VHPSTEVGFKLIPRRNSSFVPATLRVWIIDSQLSRLPIERPQFRH
jgi:hypothetical protein